MNDQLESAVSAAAALGGLFCMLYLAKLAVKVINRNEPTVWDVLRPIVTLMCVTTFSTTVTGPLNAIFNTAIVNPVVEKVTFNKNEIKTVRNTIGEGLVALFSGDKASESSTATDNGGSGGFFGHVFKKIGENVLGRQTKFNDFIDFILNSNGLYWSCSNFPLLLILESVTTFLFWLLFDIIYVLADVNLAILAVLGPFVFAIDILPGISGIGTWIARYIQISFWKVVIVMIGLFLTTASKGLFGGMTSDLNSRMLASICVDLACTVAMFSVEKISGYITQSNGANGATAGAYTGMRAAVVAARRMISKI